MSVLQGLVRTRVTLVPARGKTNAPDQTKAQDQNLSSHGPLGRGEEAQAQDGQEARAGRERETPSCKEYERVSSVTLSMKHQEGCCLMTFAAFCWQIYPGHQLC